MATSAFKRAGDVADRGSRLEITDKAVRLRGASWIEPGGATVFFDDFLGDTLSELWLATQTATGTAWAVSTTAGDPVANHGGWIAAETDNVDAAANELGLGTNATPATGGFKAERAGNGMLVFETRLTIPTAITARIINAGLSDDPTEGAAMAMSISTATWTTTAVDAALWVYSSLATDNDNFLGQTVDTNVDGTHIASTVAAVADTATRLRIELDSAGVAYFYQDDKYQGIVSTGVTETLPLIPYIAVGSTTTTSAQLEVDYVLTACAR